MAGNRHGPSIVPNRTRGVTMFQDSWGLYDEAPAYPKKWIFHPRKRSVVGPLLTIGAALLVLFEAFSRF